MLFKFLFRWNKVIRKIDTGSCNLFLYSKNKYRILHNSIPEEPNILLDKEQIYTEFLQTFTTLASEKQMFNV